MTERPEPDALADVLADLDAGLPVGPAVRAAALADPRAPDVRRALAATREQLGSLPPVAVPPELAERWAAALTAEAATRADPPRADTTSTQGPHVMPGPSGPAARPQGRGPHDAPVSRAAEAPGPRHRPPGRPDTGRPRGGRPRRPVRPALAVGALLVIVLVVAGVVRARNAPTSVDAVQLVATAHAAVGVQDAGALTDPGRRAACLRTVAPPGLVPGAPLAGGRQVVFEGHPAVVLLLVTGELGTFRAVVVDPSCGASGGMLMADVRVGR
jgi:hypothetical protein